MSEDHLIYIPHLAAPSGPRPHLKFLSCSTQRIDITKVKIGWCWFGWMPLFSLERVGVRAPPNHLSFRCHAETNYQPIHTIRISIVNLQLGSQQKSSNGWIWYKGHNDSLENSQCRPRLCKSRNKFLARPRSLTLRGVSQVGVGAANDWNVAASCLAQFPLLGYTSWDFTIKLSWYSVKDFYKNTTTSDHWEIWATSLCQWQRQLSHEPNRSREGTTLPSFRVVALDVSHFKRRGLKRLFRTWVDKKRVKQNLE